MNLLVTGGAGFIGSNFVRYMFTKHPGIKITVLDALTYAGNPDSLADCFGKSQFCFYSGRIQDSEIVQRVLQLENISHIVNFAAESHNDRSLIEAGKFIQTDAYGVFVLLEAAKKHRVEKIVHVSTDEVYGSIEEGVFEESSPLSPNTPYSASKASGDILALSHHIAYDTPVAITRGCNTFGPYQYPEKLISFFITRLLEKRQVPIYGKGDQVREWIYVEDHCSGIETVLTKGVPGEVYNMGTGVRKKNLEVTELLLELTGCDHSQILYIPDPRGKTHDQRYALSAEKITRLGWKPQFDFEGALRKTCEWYRDHREWWQKITKGEEYQSFLEKLYGFKEREEAASPKQVA
jgi:dTDP-glucose 4,6-dehydratase